MERSGPRIEPLIGVRKRRRRRPAATRRVRTGVICPDKHFYTIDSSGPPVDAPPTTGQTRRLASILNYGHTIQCYTLFPLLHSAVPRGGARRPVEHFWPPVCFRSWKEGSKPFHCPWIFGSTIWTTLKLRGPRIMCISGRSTSARSVRYSYYRVKLVASGFRGLMSVPTLQRRAGLSSARTACGSPTSSGRRRTAPRLMSPTYTIACSPRPRLDTHRILTSLYTIMNLFRLGSAS